ncbi:beta-N-acetylhexosaminidase [Acholeplasma granularum]|uniref:beta-N-acetylhexosaminidase n=1 Tax=Acholeplasma granularum TaxID=264635 RepID=UPI0004726E42|nr:beta-N-acetylhexosaminidase [Acholeplasma granularum]
MTINQILNDLKIKHNVQSFIHSDETKLDGVTLFYKNIPSALLFLKHYELTGEKLVDDGFKVKGTMIDLSRNAVFKVDYFKSVILKQALLGFNEIWLYMEDVFELENYPKFGYLRGKYTLEDIKELDNYANSLGVSLIPCIQTLGHMSQFLRWPSSSKLKDQNDVLLVSDHTYDFLNDILNFCKNAFTTNKIHIGMDETFGFSFGQYYKKFGFKDPENLFLEHLNKVYSLAKTKGFDEILMWSDMFFRHRSKTEYYYDTTITFEDEFINKLPKDITMVYWDYYNHKPEIYEKMIINHQKMNRKVIMASGTWIWTRLAYDQVKTLNTATHAIKMSKKHGVSDIIFTQWNDDGAYCDYDTSFLGLFDVTQVMHDGMLDEKYLGSIHEKDFDTLKKVSQISHLGFNAVNLLWDDLLLGIYLNNLVGYNAEALTPLIKNVENYIESIRNLNYPHYIYLANMLKNKLELRKMLLNGYFNTHEFLGVDKVLEDFKHNLLETLKSFEDNWLSKNKVFGLEVLQNRIFSQLRRADFYKQIVSNYNKGDVIAYLEEKLLEEEYLSEKYMENAFSSKH